METYSNHGGTTLAAAITTTTRPVTFSVASAAGLPATGDFRVIIGTEILLITSITGTSLTGSNVEGTTAATHASGAPVQHILTAASLAQILSDAGGGARVHGFGATLTPADPTFYFPASAFAGSISRWKIVAPDGGPATVEWWKVAGGAAIPTAADAITDSGVSLSSGTAVSSTTLSDFTSTAISVGDLLAVHLVSGSGSVTAEIEYA